MTNSETNPVGYLQEFVQKHNVSKFPQYVASGEHNAKQFECKCGYHGFETVAIASSKKQAKHEAAKKMVELLKSNGYFDKYSKVGNNSTVSDSFQSKDDMTLDTPDHQSETSSNLPTEALGSYKPSCIPTTVKKNPISLLQESCQQKFGRLPNYSNSVNLAGEYLVECKFNDKHTFGTGASKKSAKTEAAAKMCVHLNLFEQSTEQNNDFIDSEQEDVVSCVSSSTGQIKHPVSQLQEYCVGNDIQLPVYEDKPGPAGACLFVIICTVGNMVTAKGSHSTRKGAKTLAATAALKQLQLRAPSNSPTPGAVIQVPQVKHEVLDELSDEFARSSLHTTPVVLEEFKVKPVLEEFSLDDDDSNAGDKDLQNKTMYFETKQSLTFNDSVVDIDPGSDNVDKNKLEENDLKVKSESPVISNTSS